MDVQPRPRIAEPLPDVTTDRLRLTQVKAADTDGLATVFAVPAVWEFPFGRGMDAEWTAGFVARASEHWQRFGFGLWTARLLEDQTVIGYVGLSMPSFLPEVVPAERMPAVEVGWRLHPDHWGKGLASEGARAALREAFVTLELAEICCCPQDINVASVRVAQRIGMRYERTASLAATDAREAVEIDLYWMTRQHWLGANA